MARWLNGILVDDRWRSWCTKPYCTTYGGREFRTAVYNGALAARASDSPLPQGLESVGASAALAEDLTKLTRAEVRAHREAIHTLLCQSASKYSMRCIIASGSSLAAGRLDSASESTSIGANSHEALRGT